MGGVAAGGVNFVKSVAAGMADAEMANAISSLTKTTIPNCFVAGTQVWVPDDEASDSPQDDQTVADEASEIDSSFLSGLLICAAGVFGCHLIADIQRTRFRRKAQAELDALRPLIYDLRPGACATAR